MPQTKIPRIPGATTFCTIPWTLTAPLPTEAIDAPISPPISGVKPKVVLKATRAWGPAAGRPRGRRHSVVLNSQIAIPSMISPSARITPASSSAGTCQPNHVTPGSSAARAWGETERLLNTRRRIGSTA
jgi:hypothetical protein